MTKRHLFHITDSNGKTIYTNMSRHTKLEGYGWQHMNGAGFLTDSDIQREGWTVQVGSGVKA